MPRADKSVPPLHFSINGEGTRETRQLEPRVVNRELILPFSLSLSVFSVSLPQLLRCNCVPLPLPLHSAHQAYTGSREKKKERTIRVTRTLLESKTERERELRARDASRCRSDATLQRAGICQFPFPRPPSIQFNATQSVNVTRMQPHTGVPRFAMKRPLFRPVLRC